MVQKGENEGGIHIDLFNEAKGTPVPKPKDTTKKNTTGQYP